MDAKRLAIGFLALWLLVPWLAHAQPGASGLRVSQTPAGPVIEFTDGEFVLGEGLEPPDGEPVRAPAPRIYRQFETKWPTGTTHTLVGEFRFDRAVLGAGPFAFYTVSMRNNFVVYLNGDEIFRNFALPTDQKLAWYRPYMAPIPAISIKPGMNQLVIRVSSEEGLGIGRVLIGPNSEIANLHARQFFWRITGPMIANSAMLVLGCYAFLLWLGRRDEIELFFLAISTPLWFLRNYHFFAEDVPFHLPTFNAMTVGSILVAAWATFAFYIHYLKVPKASVIAAVVLLLVVPWTILHRMLWLSNMFVYIPVVMLIAAMTLFGLVDLRRNLSAERVCMLAVMTLILVVGIYDTTLAGTGYIWSGNDFYISVFNGFLYCAVFLLAFGLRALNAFRALGEANATLERRVAETRAELAASEAARQQLIVGTAIASERERLMQEMHDGIGSNLVTALAIARQQQQPDSTIRTLNRALADLKITVDSLEPVEGDLVALIGNLRHRMAADLREAGIACRWEVEDCPPLPWLDATSALHVLRVFQEAIGNVLSHSAASEMRIGCRPAALDGRLGIEAYVADNGRGLPHAPPDAPDRAGPGKGLANMKARARALSGSLSVDNPGDRGTQVTLWLPLDRPIAGS